MKHESQKDLTNERAVVDLLCKRWRCSLFKLPARYDELDFALHRDGVLKCFVEVKCRKNAQAAYPTAVIGLRKVVTGQMLAERAGVPFYLVIRWTDVIGYTSAFSGEVRLGGRYDRGDDQDPDLWMHIPVTQFVNL
jgi:hypothetical protein